MDIAAPNRVSRSCTQVLAAPPSAVFPLLCPVREAEWFEGWDPLRVLSNSGVAEPDCVFVTAAAPHDDAVWVVTRHEAESGVVEMIKVTPKVTACRLSIRLRAVDAGCEATVTYTHTSLGPAGDDFLRSFTEAAFRSFMHDWERRLGHYLRHGSMRRDAPGLDPAAAGRPAAAAVQVVGIDHLVLRVVDLERMVRFYGDALGCRVERRRDDLGLVQLRAGRSLIDLVSVDGPLGRAGGAAPGAQGRNLDHFCLRVEPFDEAAIRARLADCGAAAGPLASRYGAEGEGPSLYLDDPEGNVVEIKGGATTPTTAR